MKKFDWEEFFNRDNKIAVHCKTEEEAIDFCEQMDKRGLKFCTGNSYIVDNHWSIYEEKMIYSNDGMYGTEYSFGRCSWKIYEWSDYMKKEFAKADLRTGMVVELRDGYKYQVLKDTVVGDALSRKSGFIEISSFCNNLTHKTCEEFDIMKIYQISKFYQLQEKFWNEIDIIWNREQPKKEPQKELWSNGISFKENHRLVWNWLADHPDKKESDYFKEFNIFVPIDADCFACEYAKRARTDKSEFLCRYCPLCKDTWAVGDCLNGLYSKWLSTKGYERATIAHEIANLEWKEK